jgi:hypothetical protein
MSGSSLVNGYTATSRFLRTSSHLFFPHSVNHPGHIYHDTVRILILSIIPFRIYYPATWVVRRRHAKYALLSKQFVPRAVRAPVANDSISPAKKTTVLPKRHPLARKGARLHTQGRLVDAWLAGEGERNAMSKSRYVAIASDSI